MTPKFLLFLLFFSILFHINKIESEQSNITTDEAKNYLGQTKTVCGKVASTKYAIKSRGQPTFLNLDKPYPNHIFIVLIWGSNRHKFSNPPEVYYREKSICVTGMIQNYKGIPEIIVEEPKQLISKP